MAAAAGVSCDSPSATSDVSHVWFQVGLRRAIPPDPESIPPTPHSVLLLRILDTRCYISFECITATTHVYTLRYARQGCSHHLSPQDVITVSLTILYSLCHGFHSCDLFINWKPLPFTHFAHSPPLSPLAALSFLRASHLEASHPLCFRTFSKAAEPTQPSVEDLT